jgi:hypothetical protein
MTTQKEIQILNDVTGEFTRIIIQYWDLLGRPPLQEFVSMLPMEPAFQHINRSWDRATTDEDAETIN